ncbi:MAG TPA: VOC family protein [Thermoanaerobaculia bacterium]|jgi:catechol 2,3-dioxygenase-like lactoylglutathione lyase family enzyme|nr:VOC family protein [Thermoanaerobaculia bacterium]
MLADKEAVATIAVRDVGKAREFYVGKLGLKAEAGKEPGVLALSSGRTKVFVYESQFAGTNQATAATWVVGAELESIVRELKAKGVGFEHYEMPNMKLEGDIHVSGKMKAAWFKDPDGNIGALVNG